MFVLALWHRGDGPLSCINVCGILCILTSHVDREQLNAQDRIFGANVSSGWNTSQKAERIPTFRPSLKLDLPDFRERTNRSFQINLMRVLCLTAIRCISKWYLYLVQNLSASLEIFSLLLQSVTRPPNGQFLPCYMFQFLIRKTADPRWREYIHWGLRSSDQIKIRRLHAQIVNESFSCDFVVWFQNVMNILDRLLWITHVMESCEIRNLITISAWAITHIHREWSLLNSRRNSFMATKIRVSQ